MALWFCKAMAHVFKKCILILLELQKKKKEEIKREKEKKGIDKANGEKYY